MQLEQLRLVSSLSYVARTKLVYFVFADFREQKYSNGLWLMTVSMETVRRQNTDRVRANQNAQVYIRTIMSYNNEVYYISQ